MAVAIHVYIRDKENPQNISVEHVFYGATEEQADKIRLAHLAGCSNYANAEVQDRVAELTESIDDCELPDAEEIFDGGAELEDDDEGDEDETGELEIVPEK
jgi:hypothetical protein